MDKLLSGLFTSIGKISPETLAGIHLDLIKNPGE